MKEASAICHEAALWLIVVAMPADALPDTAVQAAISFLAEMGEQEIVDAGTAPKLDLARMEPGDGVPLEEVRRQLGL